MDNNMLSQEEIDALLGLNGFDDEEESEANSLLTSEEKDALGEIANISMGTAATTLSSLVNNKVNITTPSVEVTNWQKLSDVYEKPCVAIQVEYKEGLIGTNLMILRENDVKIIANLMMGGDGVNVDLEEPLGELHLSAICEAMNQMIGSSSTSMFSIFDKKIDILPPIATQIDFDIAKLPEGLNEDVTKFLNGDFVQIQFRMVIGDIINSVMMQLYPVNFAKDLYQNLVNAQEPVSEPEPEPIRPEPIQQESTIPNTSQPVQQQVNHDMGMNQVNVSGGVDMSYNMGNNANASVQRNIEAQPVQFQNFDSNSYAQQKENIDLIMDVPLEVSVELGRTKKPIKEILEFSPGSVIELDKLAGDPIDIMVNGKLVAKGEVVVIDEYFAIRVIDILNKKIKLY